jgi:protein arginine N-methyltransferase 3
VRGKVESIQLPPEYPKVDVIISEWMGYALLYESMLDSVLHARDRFLKPNGGVMAPSQVRMMLALCDPESVIKQRVGFWKNVYGFDMSCMLEGVYDEGIVEVVPAEAVLTSSAVVKVGSSLSLPPPISVSWPQYHRRS